MHKKILLTIKICIFVSHLFITNAFSTEVDSFTHRYHPLEDATIRLNEITNELIDEAINTANNYSPDVCNEKQMYKIMHNILAGMGAGTWPALEQLVEKDPWIQKRKIPVQKSIYKDVNGLHAPSFALHNPLAATFYINEYVIGTDKIGHFVDQGYEYFAIAYLKKKGEKAALSYGGFTEATFYGLLTTGIYAYGDLAANYLGMQFWASLTGNYKPTEHPILSCQNNRWIKNYDFDWSDYVDASLDEAINCTGQSELVWSAIEPNLIKMEKADTAHRYQCPVKPNVCHALRKKYGQVGNYILSPKCR